MKSNIYIYIYIYITFQLSIHNFNRTICTNVFLSAMKIQYLLTIFLFHLTRVFHLKILLNHNT